MAFFDALNNSCELNITPARKRKRKSEQEYGITTTAASTSCFTNAAFSSTPKKILGLEVKSIDVCHEESGKIPENPYEVLRKPPKKKTRHCEKPICFENPALNLELPEKLFNPYEVLRVITPKENSNCFSNPALNLKVQDDSVLCNPFEVQREAPNYDLEKSHANVNAFELYSDVDMQPKPCQFKLGLPFVPRVGCRIDFKDVSNSQLTPSKLLAEKLVFSPIPKVKVTSDSASEETTLDIGKELDRYQLELENSINEAKLRKTDEFSEDIVVTPPEASYNIPTVDPEKKSKFNQKLYGIPEEVENEQIIEESIEREVSHNDVQAQRQKNGANKEAFLVETNPFRGDFKEENGTVETAEVVTTEAVDELYGCSADDPEDEDSSGFDTPVPFVRAYRKPDVPVNQSTMSKESLQSKKSNKSDDDKKLLSVTNIIRKSIRKLINVHNHEYTENKQAKTDSVENTEYEHKSGFINAIRQSLRRKACRNTNEIPVIKKCETSIIDSSERTIKLKSSLLQTEYVKIEDLTNEKKYNLRNSARKSARKVRNQFLKSVFHKKQEEYDFKK